MQLGHHRENDNLALEKYEAMLKSNKVIFFDSTEFEFIIHYYIDNGVIHKAKKAITMSLSQHPDVISLRLLHIEVLIFENQLDKAEELLFKIQEIDSENEEVLIQKASILSKRSRHEEAVVTLQKALFFTDNESDIHALLGMEYLFIDDFENAKIQFETCLSLDPDDYSALYNSINCYVYLDDNEGAIDFLNRYLEMNPYCEIAWHQLGLQYVDLEDYKKAIAAFDFAIISDDTFIGAYIEKAKILEKSNNYLGAIELYTITLTIGDPTSYALLRIGKCYERLGRKETALEYYTKTVTEDPLLDKGWLAITQFYYINKDYSKALYYINKAIEIDGENTKYWKCYAKINRRLSFYEEAERGYRKSIETGNTSLENWLDRSDILWLLGEEEATVVCLEQSLEFHPENAEILYRLAGVHYETKSLDKAENCLRSALKKDSEFSIILEELFPNVFQKERVKQICASYMK